MQTTNLWSIRWCTAKGWHYVKERECEIENGEAWKQVFSKDEPEITFILSEKKPSKAKLKNLDRPFIKKFL